MIALPGVGRLDVRLLGPGTVLANEDVDGTRRIRRVVVLVSVDPGRAAALEGRADGDRAPVGAQRDRVSGMTLISAPAPKVVVRFRVRRLDVRDLLQRQHWRHLKG